ncbi:MAG TPA: outer membrane lipoprotein carrier protein LolA [Devosiaceae bacterium]|nr:outer membrane lipoprotein carrier protein LolA [Devosiaceae bacterium]
MIRRDILLLGLGLALAGTMPALAASRPLTDDEKTLVNAISAYNSSIQTMVGRFIQIDTSGQTIEGTFFLQRPDKIRFRYNPPSRQEIISIGNGFYVIDRKAQTQYAYPQNQVPLRQFLSDKIDLLRSNIIDLTQSDSYVTITLSDSSIEGTVQVALVFDKSTMDLAQWVLTEPSGQELTFSLYDVQKGVDIPKSFFYIDANLKSKAPD